MKIKNIGSRKLICSEGEMLSGQVLDVTRKSYENLKAAVPAEISIIEDDTVVEVSNEEAQSMIDSGEAIIPEEAIVEEKSAPKPRRRRR